MKKTIKETCYFGFENTYLSKTSLKYFFLDLFLIANYLSFALLFHWFFLSTYQLTNVIFYLFLGCLIYFSKIYCEKKC